MTERKMVKKRILWAVLTNMLLEICMAGIMLYLVGEVLRGSNTVGGYTMYTGLMAQLSASILMLVYIVTGIYENRLRIENVRRFDDFAAKVENNGFCIFTIFVRKYFH